MEYMNLDTIHFNNILSKKKIYETRIYDKKRQQIKLLDIINFTDRGSDRSFYARIVELSYFDNFREAIEEVGVEKVLPNAKSLDDGIGIYETFPHKEYGTYKEAAKKYGILRMKFQLIT